MYFDNDVDFRGFYKVGNETFTSKTAALYESWRSNSPIKWFYHNEIFDNFYNTTKLEQLSNISLPNLYKLRAQQLRDKYDYLILHYSGGSDSHNILMTFLKNNIRLDEVFNRRHDEVESKTYTPNRYDISNSNFQSEWDYAALPTLKWLAIHYPNIKITTSTMFDIPVDQVLNDDTFARATSYPGMINLYRSLAFSPTELAIKTKGVSIANILGSDKPVIYKSANNCFMAFTDTIPNPPIDASNKESFYWTKDMPLLPFAQAWQLYKHYLDHPQYQTVIDKNVQLSELTTANMIKENIAKGVLYKETWDFNRFQTFKVDRHSSHNSNFIIADKDTPFLKLDTFRQHYDRWLWYYQGFDIHNLKQVAPDICVSKSWLLGTFPPIVPYT